MFYKETDFKEKPIGKTPKDWEVIKLGSILKLKNGERPKILENGDIPIYGANGVMGYTSDFLIDNDFTIIIGRVGASGEIHIGRGKIWVSDNAIYSESYKKEETYLPFLYYLLKLKNLSHFATKTTHPIITQTFLNSFPVQLPPPQEQKAIAHILSIIDEAIRKTNEIIEKTERLKRGLMQELLTEGIGHKEFKDTEIGKIPKEWEIVQLRNIGNIVNGFGFPIKYQGKKDGNYIFVKVSDTNLLGNEKFISTTENTINNDIAEMLRVKIYPPGTIIFPKIGMVIYLRKVRILARPGTFDNNIMGVIPDDKVINSEFLYYYLLEKIDLTKLVGRTTAPSIRKSEVEKLKLALPSLPEQQKIAEILSTVDKRLEIEKRMEEKLERIKKTLMDLLLTGKIRVRVN